MSKASFFEIKKFSRPKGRENRVTTQIHLRITAQTFTGTPAVALIPSRYIGRPRAAS